LFLVFALATGDRVVDQVNIGDFKLAVDVGHGLLHADGQLRVLRVQDVGAGCGAPGHGQIVAEVGGKGRVRDEMA
jgi:hypothetical protein